MPSFVATLGLGGLYLEIVSFPRQKLPRAK